MSSPTSPDANSGYFNSLSGTNGSTTGLFNFNLATIDAAAKNPNNPGTGVASPTLLQPLDTSTTSQNNNSPATSSVALQNPTLENPLTGQSANQNNTNNSSTSGSPLNSNALSLLSNAGKQVLPSITSITSSINSFGAGLGFGFGGPAGTGALGAETVSPALAADMAGANAAVTGGAVDASASALGVGGIDAAAGGAAGSLTAASLSGVLGAAGLGALGGGILTNALGENQTGGAVGGGIGATIGMMVGGPIGALIGGVGGSIFGGMFGNNTPATSASAANASLSPSGALSITGQSSKNPSSGTNAFVSSATENFSSVAEAASTSLGIKFNPNVGITVSDSTQHGGAEIQVNSPNGSTGQIFFNPSDPTSTQQAYAKALTAAAQYSGYSDTANLNNWYNNTYVNSQAGASNQAPTLPNNPNASSTASNNWNSFISNYSAQQNTGAASTQTTVGGKSITSSPTQGTTNANPAASPSAATAA